MAQASVKSPAARVRLPSPHTVQEIFVDWSDRYQDAQVLVAPCGTKVGKSFGCSLWMAKENLLNPGLFSVWLAPTYAKCKIGYRYLKAMLDIPGVAKCIDGLLEIRLANGSYIKFLHGSDAEVTVEGEPVDRFVIDETSKIKKQVWYSLLTTITQTRGFGIVTGTPRGFNWYYDLYREAKKGDPMFVHATLRTDQSPYVTDRAVARAKQLLPKALFQQYYEAIFTSTGSVFGDLTNVWDESLIIPEGITKFWIHPNPNMLATDIVHGIDIAKKRDYTVFYSMDYSGNHVGYCRFRNCPYPQQAGRIEQYLNRFFPNADNHIRFDETGVGTALGDLINQLDIDASITPVTFTNKSKADMVMKTTLAIEQDWLRGPRIEQIEHEMAAYEVSVTKTGLHSYNAPDGEHDDTVCAAMLAISEAYTSAQSEEAEKLLMDAMDGGNNSSDNGMLDYIESATGQDESDDFFDSETAEDDEELFKEAN